MKILIVSVAGKCWAVFRLRSFFWSEGRNGGDGDWSHQPEHGKNKIYTVELGVQKIVQEELENRKEMK